MEMTPENLAMLFPIPKRVLKRFEVGDIYHTFSETHYPAEYVVMERIKQSVKIRRRRYDINDGCGYETIFDMKIHTNASAKVPYEYVFRKNKDDVINALDFNSVDKYEGGFFEYVLTELRSQYIPRR